MYTISAYNFFNWWVISFNKVHNTSKNCYTFVHSCMLIIDIFVWCVQIFIHRILRRKFIKCVASFSPDLLKFHIRICTLSSEKSLMWERNSGEYFHQNFIERNYRALVASRGIYARKDAAVNSVNQPQVIVDFYFTIVIIKTSQEDWCGRTGFSFFFLSLFSLYIYIYIVYMTRFYCLSDFFRMPCMPVYAKRTR